MLKRLSFLLLATGAFAGLAGFMLFYRLVVFAPGEDIRPASIEKILAMESPVMYSGGKDKIGVFFETSHRQYVSYAEIPRDFINAIVSSEDNTFFEHHGFDFSGVLRAMVANIRAGRVVQGGSTITQQTAKNLFKRYDRSVLSKLKELLFALRLEYHYPKEKILEFYANQFYVSGNGRGLGVAARYYFDKEVNELDLLECAFIAGSVKRPNYYNPFIKKDERAAVQARERSRQRVKYVLRQMLENGLLTSAVYGEMINRAIPFEQGKMYFSQNTIMDLVKEAMDEPEIIEALREHGIDNVATSGVRIVTSIEKNLQEESFTALRQELSRLDVNLRGYEREVVQAEYLALTRGKNQDRGPGSFHFARIVGKEEGPRPGVWLSLADSPDEAPDARIDEQGLMNLVGPWLKYEKNRWTEPRKEDLPKFMARLRVGDLVYVSIRRIDELTGEILLDLEKHPLLQGGVLAMRDGMLKAMVGGMDNRYFNRAIAAKRSMGSVVKPLVYAAALQLGWNSIDVLNNERDVFVYQKQPYFPRPDHLSPNSGVSLSWAGVHSENLATIWLLYHLCDRLTPAQFRAVAESLALSRFRDESAADYRRRIRDQFGVVADNEVYYEVAFERAIAELETDLIFAGRLEEYEAVSKLHYGRDFDKYFDGVDGDLGVIPDVAAGQDLDSMKTAAAKRENEAKKAEAKLRKTILKRNFLRFKKLWAGMNRLRAEFSENNLGAGKVGQTAETALYRDRLSGNYIYFDKDEILGEQALADVQALPGEQEGAAVDSPPDRDSTDEGNSIPADWEMVSREELAIKLASFRGDHLWSFLLSPFNDAGSKEDERKFWDGVLLGNSLAAGTVELIIEAINREYEQLKELEPYGEEFLYQVRDFKILVGLRYVVGLCRALGIESDLDPVLSFPLGSNVMSLLDVARAYEGLLRGTVRRYGGPDSGAGLAIIESIRTSDGEIIYEPAPVGKKVISPEIRIAISDILRKVVKFGTGRYADANVRLRSKDPRKNRQLIDLGAHVPVVGKTGTANDFTNASFAGGVPGIDEAGFFALPEGYVLTTYVGFDDNAPMVRTTTHITGASGALPLWTKIANRILAENDHIDRLDLVGPSFSEQIEFPLDYPDAGQVAVPVDPARGGIASGGADAGASLITFGEALGNGRIKPTRFFKPYWLEENN
jgi:membrane peptidoglycan carboxypeptidase